MLWLVGDNGAGKSTVSKVLSGAVITGQRQHRNRRQTGQFLGPGRRPRASH
ncbi:MAG: Ribose ABC transporter, ATP-binding protein RbsA (TC 3.A.1.2.1) [Candidatus Burkholderia crenata]|nr:MAG: Ribose ABC transporter, ATP-binding protein RbsA (TC 3.A.1.2.1) [Candidatus Burkholderia crenata]